MNIMLIEIDNFFGLLNYFIVLKSYEKKHNTDIVYFLELSSKILSCIKLIMKDNGITLSHIFFGDKQDIYIYLALVTLKLKKKIFLGYHAI